MSRPPGARRFACARVPALLAYGQRLRVEAAKRCPEAGDEPADVGTVAAVRAEAAFFRCHLNHLTGVSPGLYRRSMRSPGPAPKVPAAVA